MCNRVVVCLVVTLQAAATAFAQAGDWRSTMERGRALEAANDYAGARALYEEAAHLLDGVPATDPHHFLAWNSVASMDDLLGRYLDATVGYRRALAAAEQSRGKSSSEYATILGSLGSMYIELGQVAKGEGMLRQSIVIQESLAEPDEVRLASGRTCLAEALMATGRYDESKRLLEAALAVWEKRPERWRERGATLSDLGVLDLYRNRFAEAQRFLEEALRCLESGLPADHPMLSRVLNNLAAACSRTGRRPEAVEYLKRALAIVDRSLGASHPVNGILLRNYAALLRQTGDKANARKAQDESTRVLRQSALRNGAGMVIDVSALPQK